VGENFFEKVFPTPFSKNLIKKGIRRIDGNTASFFAGVKCTVGKCRRRIASKP